ncbi:MAG: 4-alpha-glucanotransferase [Roseburia intestinalis]
MRTSGVLMHISSLPSPYGIGTMGKEARKFADFLEKCRTEILADSSNLSDQLR